MKFLNRFKRKSDIEQPLVNAPEKPSTGSQNPALRPAVYPQKRTQPDSDEVRLELGDFMHRIPSHLLAEGPHDLSAELRFEIQELSDRINNGQTTIAVSEIYKRLPHIFRGEIRDSDNIEVRFPWQKLAKLVSLSAPGRNGTLQPDAAAGALAERLRTKLAAGVHPAPTHEQGKVTPPVLPGRGDPSATWFSRPTMEHGKDTVITTPIATNVPVLPKSAGSPVEKTSPTRPDNAPHNPGPTPAKPAGTSDMSAKTMIQELREPDMPQELQRKLASVQGEYERQFAELEKQRRSLIEARDASNNELLKLRQDLESLQEALAEEKSATEVSHELLVKSASERDAMQATLDRQLAELNALRDRSKIDELTAERDALLQQKAYLSSQMAEMNKRGALTVTNPAHVPSHAGGSRQLEEAQRRILGLEASQRETALELSREKEARSKVEKILVAAEKVQEQSANYMESTKAEIRKEIEASVRQREIEMRKTQKDLQDQVSALSDQARKAATELENARNRASTLEQRLATGGHAPLEAHPDELQAQAVAQLEADIEQYRERLKSLIAERDAARAEAEEARHLAAATNGHAEGFAKAEGEILELRRAQSELVASHTLEREKLLGEKDTLTGKIKSETAAREELFTTLDQDHTSVVRENEELKRRLSETEKALHALDAERVEAAVANRGQSGDSPLVAELEKLNEQQAQALHARDEALAQAKTNEHALHESRNAQQNLASEQQQLLAELGHEREQVAGLKHSFETLTGELTHLREQHATLNATLKNEHVSLSSNLDSEQTNATQLAEQLAAAETHAAALRDQYTSAVQAHETALEEKHKLLATLADLEKSHTSALLAVTQERDQARAEREALGAELSGARKQHQHLIVSFEEDRAALANARETIQKKVGALEQHRSELTGNLQARENLIAELEAKQRETHESHQASSGQFEASLSALAQQLEASQSAHTDAQRVASEQIEELNRARTEAEQLHTQAHSELEQLRQAHAEKLEQLHSKGQLLAETSAHFDNERTQHAASRAELDNLAHRLAESETAKAAHKQAEKAAAAQIEAASHELGQLRKAQDHAISELRLKEQLHADVTASFDSEREKHTATRSELDNLTRRLTESEATLFAARAAQQQAELALAEHTEKARAQIERASQEISLLRTAHEKATAELQAGHQLHSEASAALDGERALHAATRTQMESLSRDLAKTAEEAQASAAAASQEIEHLHKTADATEREHQHRLAAAENSAVEIAAKAKADLDDLRVALQIARRERDETRHEADSAINNLQKRAQTAEETIAELQARLESATRSRDEALANLNAIRAEHEITVRHRDDLAGKITRISEHHRRLLEDLGTGMPAEPAAATRQQTLAMPVIEVHNPEVFAPEPGNGIAFPRVRPVPIPPPRVQSQ